MMVMKRKEKQNEGLGFGNKVVHLGLKILKLNVSLKTKDLLVQIFNFGIVGVVATLIDFIFLYLFRDLCNLPLILSNTLSFIISLLYNYWASLTFVFHVNRKKDQKKNFVIFILCSVIGLLLNDLIVWIITDCLHVYYLLSKVVATLFVMVFNFVTRKKFLE